MILRIAGLVLIILLSSMYHPVHVSVTNMDIDSESGMITVSIKLFSDDFEELIFTKYGRKLEITSEADPGDNIDAVNRYIAEVLRLTINGSDLVAILLPDTTRYSRVAVPDLVMLRARRAAPVPERCSSDSSHHACRHDLRLQRRCRRCRAVRQ